MNKLTTSLVVVGSLLAFAGCKKKKEENTVQKPAEGPAATPPPPPENASTPLTGTALADRYRACIGQLNDGKLDDFQKDCLETGYKIHDHGDGSEHTAGEFLGWMKSMRQGMPDMKYSPQLIMVSGRNVIAVNLVTGTHTAAMPGPTGTEAPATGKKLGLFLIHRLAINDANKATEEWVWEDPGTMIGQLGMAPAGSPPVRPATDKGWDGAPIVVVTADDAKEKAAMETTRKAVDAVNAGKYADAAAVLAPDAMVIDAADPRDVKGPKEFEASLKQMFAPFKDSKLTLNNQFAAGDYVIQLGTATGTHDKDMGPIKKTGKPVAIDYAEVVKVADGKVTNLWRFRSNLQMMMQLGVVPAPAAAPAPTPAAGSAAPTMGSAAPAAGSAGSAATK